LSSIEIFIYVFYVVPAVLCLIGYFFRTIKKVKEDQLRQLEHGDWYLPEETIGTVLGRIIISLIPGLNIVALLVDLFQETFEKIIPAIKRFVSIPLVKKKAN
jgi:uncharacterized membrane protein